MKTTIVKRQARKRRLPKKTTNFSWATNLLLVILGVFCLAIPLALAQAQDQGPIIGIDLGTTYSCVGVYKNEGVEIIANDQGNLITPSYVAFTDSNERLVGDAAKNQATINPENTIFDVKRLIGREYSDPSVQADKKLVPFKIVSNKEGKPRISIHQDGSDSVYTPEEISAMVLGKMKATAEAFLGEPVTRAVVTVPAYFNGDQRQATKDAGRIAGLTVERIINEPTAAAIAYGMDREMDDKNVLVFDLGGGTFGKLVGDMNSLLSFGRTKLTGDAFVLLRDFPSLDVTLLNIDDGAFEVLASHGDTHLGGEDFDQRVMQYFIKKAQKTQGADISGNNRALQKLRKETERVKRALSTQTQARLEIDDLAPGYDLQETLTRARFEELNNDLFKKTLEPVKQVLERAKLKISDVDHVVLVGGSTRIPKIQQLLSEYFDGKELSKSINPDEAVAYGAAVQGAILGGTAMGKAGKMVLLENTSLSMGIKTVGGVFTKIIPRDTTIPTRKSQVFSTHQDNQSRVTIDVYEGERPMTSDNHSLGKFELAGIVPAPRGVPQIEVTFQVDANGILQVSAEDKGTGKAEKITITADKGRLSEADIKRMVEEAEEYAEEDRVLRERVDSRNGLEAYAYNLKTSLEGDTPNMPADNKKELFDMIDETLDWIDDNPEASKDELDDHRKELEQVAQPLIREFYNSEGAYEDEDDGDFEDGDL